MLLNIKALFIFFFMSFNLSAQLLPEGFVFLDEEIPNIRVELRYATKKILPEKIVEGYYSKKR